MAKKKGSGQGSIFKTANGKWRGQILIDGKRRSFTAKTKSEVAEKMAAAKVDYMRGNFVSSENINFKEFAEMWLKTVKEHVLSFNSFYHLNAVFRKHLFPILGDLSLRHINKDDIKKLAEYLSLKKLNRTYAAKCIGRVRELLDYAISEELLTSNVVSNTDVSHILASCNNSKKVTAYDVTTAKKILEYTKKIDKYAIFYVLLQTGMRLGEAGALTWSDIDLNNRTVNINKTLLYVAKQGLIIEHRTKTKAGFRTISITASLCDFLAKLKEKSNSKKIFHTHKDTYISAVQNRAKWIRACAEMGIEYKNIHALRHTWATLTLSAGANVKVVSRMLGHSNVAITMNTYQTVLKEHQEDVTSRMEELLLG